MSSAWLVALAVSPLAAPGPAAPAGPREPRLVLVRQHPAPVITTRTPGAEGNRYGFEGGRAVKVGDAYHLLTTEMVGDPMWVKTRFGHWTSRDRVGWTRVGTVRESSGEFEGQDPRASLWSPLVVWDPADGRWNLFYVAYRSMPGDGTRFLLNHAGEIWGAVSREKGRDGIRGPFEDVGVVMRSEPDSLAWEGLQGTDSFVPWRVGGRWRAFCGSAEVPGGWIAVYDSETPDGVGWAWSEDGVRWSEGRDLVLQPKAGEWAKDMRTPLGLVPEGKGRFTLFYTGFEQAPDWPRILDTGTGTATCAVGMVELRLEVGR